MFETLTSIWTYLPGMLVLMLLSGFFSGSEAAFFSLTLSQRRELGKATRVARTAQYLLERSERLLMGVLFWNLAINLSYFSLVSQAALRLQPLPSGPQAATLLTISALVAIILLGEFLPKSLAVLCPLPIVKLVTFPLSFAIRLLDGFLPVIKLVNETSRRLLWPGLKPEKYLESADLERAIELSTDDAQLVEQERQVLRNVIQLSEIRVEEWMRPRTQFVSFVPPLGVEQFNGHKPASGYMLVTNASGSEVVSAIHVNSLLPSEIGDLALKKKSLVVVPWCSSIAEALKRLRRAKRRVAVVVNEYGETIGILTWEDIFESILHSEDSKSHRELARAEVRLESPGVWMATGMTKLRRLERLMGIRLNVSRSLTVGGVVQEQLHRLPEKGDVCELEELLLEVVEAGQRGEILVRISQTPAMSQQEEA